MNTINVNEIFIGNGAALDANNTNIAAITKQVAIVGSDMTTLNPAGGDTITTQPVIYMVNKLANGDLKRSFPLRGTSITSYKAEHYAPARRCVASIGYQRGSIVDGTTVAAGGSIEVNNSTIYSFTVRFKWDKQFYSERPEILRGTFTSSAAATQLSVATQIAAAINSSPFGSQPAGIKVIKAVVIGDGTGVSGLTGATNYGVEMWSLDVNQFQNTTYNPLYVYFSAQVDDASGFGTTTTTSLVQTMDPGMGTYNQIYTKENYNYQFEGVLNRTKFPIPALAYLSSSTFVTSGNVAAAATTPTGNVTAVINEDVVTVATATTGLRPGEVIDINGVQYEIKYILSATKFVITVPATASYGPAANIKVKYLYNVFTITTSDVTTGAGANMGMFANKSVMIATPSIDAAAADPFDRTLDAADTSAECLDLLDILNAWMTSTPLAPANPTLVG
jgi:hypothetical protein